MFKLKTFTASMALLMLTNIAHAQPIQYLPKITELPSFLGEKDIEVVQIPAKSDMGNQIISEKTSYFYNQYNVKSIKKDNENYYVLNLSTYGTPKKLKLSESSSRYSVSYLTEYGFVYAMKIETDPTYDDIYVNKSYETFKNLLVDSGYNTYPVASKIIDGNFTNELMNGESFTKDGAIISIDKEYVRGKGEQIIIIATTRENKSKYTEKNKELYMKKQKELKEKEAKDFAKKMF